MDDGYRRLGSAFATAINSKGTVNIGTGRGYVLCPEGAGRFPVYRR